MGLAGIPWWTTDIGGFMTDDAADPDFRELLLRWFEFAVFPPILRMHGDRGPHDIPTISFMRADRLCSVLRRECKFRCLSASIKLAASAPRATLPLESPDIRLGL